MWRRIKLQSYDGPVEREFIRGMVTHVDHSIVSNALGVMLLAGVCFLAPFGTLLFPGLAARIVAIGITAYNTKALRDALNDGRPLDRYINMMSAGLFIAGMTWSALIGLIPIAAFESFPAVLVFAIVLTGVSLITATAAPVPRAKWAFVAGFALTGTWWVPGLISVYGAMPLLAIGGLALAIVYFSTGLMREARRAAELLVENRAIGDRLSMLNGDLAKAIEQATYLADHDQLTSLYNRRAFDERVDIIASEGREHEFSLLLIDLDHFKKINDCCGHAAGDKVLRATGDLLWEVVSVLPKGAFAARIGGEEFALLIPLLHGEALGEFARTLCLRFRTISPPEGYDGDISASIGHARWSAGEPFHRLAVRVDGALYAAKGKGRNRAIAA